MHIVLLSDHETRGGAAIAACRLAAALAAAGHRVTRLAAAVDPGPHPWETIALTPSRLERLSTRVVPDAIRHLWLARGAGRQLRRALERLRPDLINVHGLHGAASLGWSPALAGVCAEHAPVIWTLHDMWSFTGRCAYSGDCRRFLTGCDAACPTPDEYPALTPSRIAAAWQARRRLLTAKLRLAAVSPSRWLAGEALAGLWAGSRVEVIPNGLPLDVYQPVERAEARRALGIAARGPVLLIAARRFNRHKGAQLFLEALGRTVERPLTVLVLGPADFMPTDPGIHWIPLGYIEAETKRALAYNAADLLVHPALHDNLPNVVLEAMACGTPTVAMPVGGLPELVRPGQTGWLAAAPTAAALADTLTAALGQIRAGLDLRSLCRASAEADYSDAVQAQRYLSLAASLFFSESA
jgi:glycosyltransferase involved in cell wall biosynthesis